MKRNSQFSILLLFAVTMAAVVCGCQSLNSGEDIDWQERQEQIDKHNQEHPDDPIQGGLI